jgi:NAD(P)-dependent dehydrogenase (short-subunit alcohol dehydrogenase family)
MPIIPDLSIYHLYIKATHLLCNLLFNYMIHTHNLTSKLQPNTMSQPVGIVTGGASGIGLAVTKHLLTRGYKVVIADVNDSEGERLASSLGSNAIFQHTDVSSFEQQRALFDRAFKWGGNRLDFLAANAGVDDRQSLYETEEKVDENGLPLELNLKTVKVCLDAAFQGIWLFKWYARRNKVPGGKVVITASAAGL